MRPTQWTEAWQAGYDHALRLHRQLLVEAVESVKEDVGLGDGWDSWKDGADAVLRKYNWLMEDERMS